MNPRLRCATCAATAVLEARVRNVGSVPPAGDGHRHVRRPARAPRRAHAAAGPGRRASAARCACADPHLWSPADPYLYPAAIEVAGRRPARRPLERAHRRALGPGRRRPPRPQRPAGAAARRRPARGQRVAGLRGRQRVAALAAGPGEGARRDDAADALPDASLHPRGRRPRGAADLVGDPGLLAQEHADRRHHAARPGRAAPQHRDQRQPSVGADLVDRQRAVVEAGADAGHLHPARPSAPRTSSTRRGRWASPWPATRAPAARPATARST